MLLGGRWDVGLMRGFRAEYLVDDVSPYMLHMSMFVTTIREQASDEQKAYWIPKIERFEIIGAYAQVSHIIVHASHETDENRPSLVMEAT